MADRYDVIVVGVGAMGSSACYHLARRGARALGLEQFDIPHALGSSHGFSRMIRMAYYEHPDYVPLLRRAYELWREVERASGQTLFHETGGVYMGPPGGEIVSGTVRAAREHGLPHEVLSRDDLARRFPQFHVPDHFTGVWEPRAGFLLPEKVVAAQAELALRAGAELHGREEVLQWDTGDDVAVVRTSKGEYRADQLIFCGGPWTGKLVRDLGVELAVTRQVLGWTWPRRPELFATNAFPVWGIEAPDGSLSYGFPMMSDNPGLKVARHGRGPVTDPDHVLRAGTPADEVEVHEILNRNLPDGDGPLLSLRVCLYTNSPDGHFIIDRHPKHPRVTLACGFSGHGFKFASVVGEVLADLALDGRSPLPVGFLGSQRFLKNSG
jgi:sarcosine oxidase